MCCCLRITETGAEVLTRPGSVIKDGRIVDPVKAWGIVCD
jgi:hypothetical protein